MVLTDQQLNMVLTDQQLVRFGWWVMAGVDLC